MKPLPRINLRPKGAIAYLALGLFALILYLVIYPKDFLYDDAVYLLRHPTFSTLTTWRECVLFTIKPGRPVADFLIASVGKLAGPIPASQVLASVICHGLVVLLLILNLKLLTRRYLALGYEKVISSSAIMAISALFAVLPIHSETLVIAQFRSEALGTLFTLLACACAQWIALHPHSKRKVSFGLLIFFCLGMATLSKETFVVIAPAVTLMGFLGFDSKQSILKNRAQRSFFFFITASAIFWSALLALFLIGEKSSVYGYGSALGLEKITLGIQLKLMASAILEGGVKVFLGSPLTTTRLLERPSLGSSFLTPFNAVLVIALVGMGLLALRKKDPWYRWWGDVLMICAVPYLVIPNVNIGSEHYWYAASAALWVLLVSVLWNVCSHFPQGKRLFHGVVALSFFVLVPSLVNRLLEMRTEKTWSQAEAENCPDCLAPLAGWVVVGSQAGEPRDAILPSLKTLGKIAPDHFLSLNALYAYHLQAKESDKIEKVLARMLALKENYTNVETRLLADNFYYTALDVLKEGRCSKAEQYFKTAKTLDPSHHRWEVIGDKMYRSRMEKSVSCRDEKKQSQ